MMEAVWRKWGWLVVAIGGAIVVFLIVGRLVWLALYHPELFPG
jgi:hypothetical protein